MLVIAFSSLFAGSTSRSPLVDTVPCKCQSMFLTPVTVFLDDQRVAKCALYSSDSG